MALIEGFRVQNYRALRDVTLGKLSTQQGRTPLTPFTVVIGKNGVGKSTLFDAFGFVADCLAHDVEQACDMKQRGGYERLHSRGSDGPICFEIYYREAVGERPMTYELSIALDDSGRPFVESELLKQRRKGQKRGRPYPFLRLNHGKGLVWAGEEAVEVEGVEEDRSQTSVELTDLRQLGIATLGTLKVFAYLLLMEDPEPPPFICIEEPENGLYHKLLEALAQEFRAHASGKKNSAQIFVTTHQPYFVDALSPDEVWILEKATDGYSEIRRVSDLDIVKNLVEEGLPLGGLWYSDYLEAR